MPKAKFLFTTYKNSFKVVVENLEELSIEQIQEIQRFVEKRKGFFDFNSYTFSIQKKISFEEFKKLIESLSFNAILFNKPLQELQKERVSFGQYKGLYYSDLPDSYLLWLKNNYHGKDKNIIISEIKRRKL